MGPTKSSNLNVVTIGAHGFSEAEFFRAIENAGVDTFCDIRQRRGMRGPLYAFANSGRLQRRLDQLGVRYLHLRELAPSDHMRSLQRVEDERLGVQKRSREALSEVFVDTYQSEILSKFDPDQFLELIGPDARTVAFFCVERYPTACHRSLVADHVARVFGAQVEHLTP